MIDKFNYFVFDVEATTLHGDGFAVAAIVADIHGNEIDSFCMMSEEGALKSSDWVVKNVLPKLKDIPNCGSLKELRERFFAFYLKHKDSCKVYGDVIYPVETNFLNAIAQDKLSDRDFSMPFLRDISAKVPTNLSRIHYSELIKQTTDIHNPLVDVRASLKCLVMFEEDKNRALSDWNYY